MPLSSLSSSVVVVVVVVVVFAIEVLVVVVFVVVIVDVAWSGGPVCNCEWLGTVSGRAELSGTCSLVLSEGCFANDT